jgi:hypothetical protein
MRWCRFVTVREEPIDANPIEIRAPIGSTIPLDLQFVEVLEFSSMALNRPITEPSRPFPNRGHTRPCAGPIISCEICNHDRHQPSISL